MELVICNNGKATTTSIKVAEYFGKPHNDVMKAARKLLEDSEVVGRGNFSLTSYTTDQNKELPMYDLDRDGFTLLAMGFTGKTALTFKMKYIDAFNAAEKALTQLPAITSPMQALETFFVVAKQQQAQLADHQNQINLLENKFDSITPSLSSAAMYRISGIISSIAKLYRRMQEVKRICMTHAAAQGYITSITLEKFGINDIAYIKDVNAVTRYLQGIGKTYQAEYDKWFSASNLFE